MDEYVKVTECQRLHEQTQLGFEQLAKDVKALCASVERLDRRLYRDNGTVSVQTRLDRHERVIRGMTWLGGITMSFLLMVVLGAIVTHVLGVDPAVLP